MTHKSRRIDCENCFLQMWYAVWSHQFIESDACHLSSVIKEEWFICFKNSDDFLIKKLI